MGAKMKRLAIALLTLLPALAWGQAFPLFDPANGILKGQNSTYVTTAATSADVISLWTATCNATTFLRGDGQCQTPSGAGIGTVTSVALTFTGSGISVSGSPVTSSGTLALSGTLNVATGGTGATTLTGLLEGNGTSAIDAAEVADVITLWTGTCNATTFLRGDGSCQSVPGTNDASSLTTGTLVDARLSANVPLLNAANTFTAGQTIANTTGPVFLMSDTDATANARRYRVRVNSGSFTIQGENDAGTATSTPLTISQAVAGTIDTIAVVSTALTHNGNAVLNSTSSLNGSNIGSGTVPDARLSSTVANYNDATPNFSVVGNQSFTVENSSTGQSFMQIRTNGVQRAYLCSSTTSGDCVSDSTANDTVFGGPQRVRITTNGGTSSQVIVTPAQIDLNATTVNANSSRINTVANTGKVAFGKVNASAGTLSNSLNVTGISKLSTGLFTIDVTAAGFTSQPACTVSTVAGNRPAGISGINTTGVDVNVCENAGPSCTLIDVGFNFICHGL
jgi:hypothetical protein